MQSFPIFSRNKDKDNVLFTYDKGVVYNCCYYEIHGIKTLFLS